MENKDMNELDMTQLDRINGGVFGEVSADSALLHRLGLLDEEFNCIEVTVDWKNCSEKVDGAWEKVGIVCNSSPTHNITIRVSALHGMRQERSPKTK